MHDLAPKNHCGRSLGPPGTHIVVLAQMEEHVHLSRTRRHRLLALAALAEHALLAANKPFHDCEPGIGLLMSVNRYHTHIFSTNRPL